MEKTSELKSEKNTSIVTKIEQVVGCILIITFLLGLIFGGILILLEKYSPEAPKKPDISDFYKMPPEWIDGCKIEPILPFPGEKITITIDLDPTMTVWACWYATNLNVIISHAKNVGDNSLELALKDIDVKKEKHWGNDMFLSKWEWVPTTRKSSIKDFASSLKPSFSFILPKWAKINQKLILNIQGTITYARPIEEFKFDNESISFSKQCVLNMASDQYIRAKKSLELAIKEHELAIQKYMPKNDMYEKLIDKCFFVLIGCIILFIITSASTFVLDSISKRLSH